MSQSFRVAIVGATGAVGQKFIECIERRKFPVSETVLFASPRSEGKILHVNGKPCRIVGLTPGGPPGRSSRSASTAHRHSPFRE